MDEHKYPLHFASKHQRDINNLPNITHRVDIDKPTNEKETPLMYAAKYGHLSNLKLLIEHGANLHLKSMYGFTAMCYAARNGHLPIIQHFLSLNLPVLKGYLEESLSHAVYQNRTSVVEELLKHGSYYGCKQLMKHIVLNKNVELFKIFLKHDYPINEPMLGSYLIFEIITINWLDGLYELMPYHPDLSITNNVGNTALHYSVANCDLKMTTLLLDYDPSLIDKVDHHDYSPLAIACIRQHVDTVKLLLAYKANPNEISYRYNRTILMSAAMWSTLDVIIVLLQHGAKATTKIANKTVSNCCLYESNDNYKKRYLLEAEKVAGCSKENLMDVTSKLMLLDPPTFHIISPFCIQDIVHELKIDEVACYVAIHEGENETLTKYREGKVVCFSQSPIRCIGRSFGTRRIRKSITSYLVYKNRSILHNRYVN
jgi:ankyrin repeat protein